MRLVTPFLVSAYPYDVDVSTAARFVRQHTRQLLPAYVAAIILGIFGMHALMQHCPTPEHTMSAATSTVAAVGHHAEHMAAAPVAELQHGLAQLDEQPGGSLKDMFMLCAAMVLGAGLVMALLLRPRHTTVFRLAQPRRTTWRPILHVTATGPPPSLAVAVIRC